ncbi:MAG TPA: hypothetical protein VMS98_13850 [Thermoanaerobaculia bacterium]|nr:hypothetical protein [Thermoanaerobaculia bacterium]
MAQDFEQTLREIFGEQISKFSQFQSDQVKKLTTKLHEIAREAVKDELTRLNTEVADLQTRLARLESERAQAAAEAVEPSF